MPHLPRPPAVGPLVGPLINKAADLQVAALARLSSAIGDSVGTLRSTVARHGVGDTVRAAVSTGLRSAKATADLLRGPSPAQGPVPPAAAPSRGAGTTPQAVPEPRAPGQSSSEARGHSAGSGGQAATAGVDDQAEVSADAPSADDLPIPNYDQQPIGSLRARIVRLNAEQLRQLRAYELAHASRPQYLTTIDNRIAKVTAASALSTDADDAQS